MNVLIFLFFIFRSFLFVVLVSNVNDSILNEWLVQNGINGRVRIDKDNIRKLYRKSINNTFLVSRPCLFLLQLVLFLGSYYENKLFNLLRM